MIWYNGNVNKDVQRDWGYRVRKIYIISYTDENRVGNRLSTKRMNGKIVAGCIAQIM